MQESKSCALPLGDSPINLYFCRCKSKGGYRDSNPGPPEPQSGALTNCAIPTIAINVLEGIRTPDPRLRRPLLYPAELRTHCPSAKAGDGNRTHVSSLEGWCSTIELHPHKIGVTGFEPAASWSQTRRSSQTEPHPVMIFYLHHPDALKIISKYSEVVNHFFTNNELKFLPF